MDVIVHPEADNDLVDAIGYYAREAGQELAGILFRIPKMCSDNK